MTDLDKAREWAESVGNIEGLMPGTRATVEVIQSLPDQWVDVEKVREVINGQLSVYTRGTASHYIAEEITRKLKEALIAPKLPTLADMTQEERQACLRAQAQTWHEVGIIVWVDEMTEIAQLITRVNGVLERKFKDVTPLPDLPKLEWPGSAPDDVAYATGGVLTTQDVVDECRAVRKERALPRPEDVPDPHPGEAWLVNTREGEQREALKAGNRWYVKDGDDVEEWVEEALTPISRLVPEPPALPEGMRLADHEEYGRVVVSPKDDLDSDYRVFCSQDHTEYGADWWYAHKSELNFLGGDQHA